MYRLNLLQPAVMADPVKLAEGDSKEVGGILSAQEDPLHQALVILFKLIQTLLKAHYALLNVINDCYVFHLSAFFVDAKVRRIAKSNTPRGVPRGVLLFRKRLIMN